MIQRLKKIAFGSVALFIVPILVRAQIIPIGCTDSSESSPCGLDQFAQVFVNLYNLGVQWVGAVTLLFFVIGGFLLLTSAGRSEQIEWGKRTLIGATIGLFIILFSFVLVRFVQDDILQVEDQYILTNDERCSGKPDGTPCEQNGQNVFACISGVCTTQTLCEFRTTNKNCTARSICDPATIETGLCPGNELIVCCVPEGLDIRVPQGSCEQQYANKECVADRIPSLCQSGTTSYGEGLCNPGSVCCTPLQQDCAQTNPGYECRSFDECLNGTIDTAPGLCGNTSLYCCQPADSVF